MIITCEKCGQKNRCQEAEIFYANCGNCKNPLIYTHYDTLGLDYGASEVEIKEKYHQIVQHIIPEKIKPYQEAYMVLSDSKKRSEYHEVLQIQIELVKEEQEETPEDKYTNSVYHYASQLAFQNYSAWYIKSELIKQGVREELATTASEDCVKHRMKTVREKMKKSVTPYTIILFVLLLITGVLLLTEYQYLWILMAIPVYKVGRKVVIMMHSLITGKVPVK